MNIAFLWPKLFNCINRWIDLDEEDGLCRLDCLCVLRRSHGDNIERSVMNVQCRESGRISCMAADMLMKPLVSQKRFCADRLLLSRSSTLHRATIHAFHDALQFASSEFPSNKTNLVPHQNPGRKPQTQPNRPQKSITRPAARAQLAQDSKCLCSLLVDWKPMKSNSLVNVLRVQFEKSKSPANCLFASQNRTSKPIRDASGQTFASRINWIFIIFF